MHNTIAPQKFRLIPSVGERTVVIYKLVATRTMKKVLCIICTLLWFTSCNQTIISDVEIKQYTWTDSLRWSERMNLLVNKRQDTIEYMYVKPPLEDSLMMYFVRRGKNFDSSIIYHNIEIPLINQKVVNINDKNLQIKKYRYNLPDMADEDEYIYFTENYGIILVKSTGWGQYDVIDDETETGKRLIEKILKDTTGFYGFPD